LLPASAESPFGDGLKPFSTASTAAHVASAAQTASVRRRFYRFFQFVRLDSTLAARVVVELLDLSGSARHALARYRQR
jgi:hypothetical protein